MARALARGWADPVLCSDCGHRPRGRARRRSSEGRRRNQRGRGGAARSWWSCATSRPARRGGQARSPAVAKAVASVLGGIRYRRCRRRTRHAGVRDDAEHARRGAPRASVCYTPGARRARRARSRGTRAVRAARAGDRARGAMMEAAGAVMGVGPAYQALLAEAQVDAGVRHGLTPSVGRASWWRRRWAERRRCSQSRDYDTLTVRREVTSPGGSTARGLAALERAGVRGAFQDAIDAVVVGGGDDARRAVTARSTSPTTSGAVQRLHRDDLRLHPAQHACSRSGCDCPYSR